MSHARRPAVSFPLIVALTLIQAYVVAQSAVQLLSVRADSAFHQVGSNGSGLVVSVQLDEQMRRTSDNVALIIFDGDGRVTGSAACLAVRFLGGVDPTPPWMLLDDGAGTLARTYSALVNSHAAVVIKSRNTIIQKAGRYEFVYLVATTNKKAALAYGDDVVHRPARSAQPLIGTFTIPWP